MRILFIVNHPRTDASCRHRVFQYVPYLQAAGHEVVVRPFTDEALFDNRHQAIGSLSATGRFIAALARRLGSMREIGSYDVVVIHREAFPFGPPILEMLIASWARRTIFSFDDALYAQFPHAPNGASRVLYRLKYGRKLGPLLRRVDSVIAGSEPLAQYARDHNGRVRVIPTAVNMRDYPLRPEQDQGPIVIGWMGSPSTSNHLGPILPALQALESSFGEGVEFRFIGDSTLNLPLRNLHVRPWSQQSQLAELHGFDIGLMPLDNSEWTRAKCAFKAIQYLAVGTPAIASPVGAAVEVVRPGLTGFLADDLAEWTNALHKLVSDCDLRRKFGTAGRSHVAARFSVEATLPALLEELEGGPVGVPRTLARVG